MTPKRRTKSAPVVRHFPAELDAYLEQQVKAGYATWKSGNPVGIVDAWLAVVWMHFNRTAPRKGRRLADGELVSCPAWLGQAAMRFAQAVALKAPHLLGARGRHARPARAFADRQKDAIRYHAIRVRLEAGDSLRQAYRGASAALAKSDGAGSPKVMEQAWRRVHRNPPRAGWSLGDSLTFEWK